MEYLDGFGLRWILALVVAIILRSIVTVPGLSLLFAVLSHELLNEHVREAESAGKRNLALRQLTLDSVALEACLLPPVR